MRRHFRVSLMAMILAGVAGAETPASAPPSGVPKGAVETRPGVYRFIDKDKKVWIYRKTPFGFQRSAETEDDKAPQSEPESASQTTESERNRTKTPFGESKASKSGAPATKVIESGDSITFERPSPFGVYRWTRKKSELNAEERRLWEAQRPVQAETK